MSFGVNITKLYLYNFDPLKPRFYIVKLGFTWVYVIFLISAQKHGFWVLVRIASQNILSENFQFLEVKFSVYLNSRIFIMKTSYVSKPFTSMMGNFLFLERRNVFHYFNLSCVFPVSVVFDIKLQLHDFCFPQQLVTSLYLQIGSPAVKASYNYRSCSFYSY